MKTKLILFIQLFYVTNGVAQSSVSVIDDILNFEISETRASEINAYYSDYNYLRNQFGINFSASWQHKFGEGLIENDLTLNNGQTYYKAAFEWDILKQGWLANRNKAAIAYLDAEISKLDYNANKRARNYYAQFALAAFLFDVRILEKQNERIKFLSAQRKVLDRLKADQLITNEPILELQKRYEAVQYSTEYLIQSNGLFLEVFDNGDIQASGISNFDVLQFDLKLKTLLDAIEFNATEAQINGLLAERIDRQYSELNNISLSAQISYNRQISFDDSKRDFTAVGINLKVPLILNRKERNKKIGFEKQIIQDEQFQTENNRKKELLTLFNEFAYKRKQIIDLNENSKKILEKIRVQNVIRRSVDLPAPNEFLQLLDDDLIAIDIEKIGLEKQIVQLLLKMNMLLDADSHITEFLFERKENSPIALTTGGTN